jgi:hypothetical protein
MLKIIHLPRWIFCFLFVYILTVPQDVKAIYELKKNGKTYYCKIIRKGICHLCGAENKTITIGNGEYEYHDTMRCPGDDDSETVENNQPENEKSQ